MLGVAQRAAAKMDEPQSDAGMGSLLMVAQDAARHVDDNASGLSGLGSSVASGMDSLLQAARDAIDGMSAAGASDP